MAIAALSKKKPMHGIAMNLTIENLSAATINNSLRYIIPVAKIMEEEKIWPKPYLCLDFLDKTIVVAVLEYTPPKMPVNIYPLLGKI